MLTGDLLRVTVKGTELHPGYVDPARPSVQEPAEALIQAFAVAAEERWSREQLDDEVQAIIGDNRDHKFYRGLAKVLSDRAEFETETEIDPIELRAEVFCLARELGPLAFDPGPLGRPVAADVVACVAERRNTTVEAIQRALYADRHEEQRLMAFPPLRVDELLHRYNVALVQATLLHATKVRVELREPTVPRLRQLFRYVKFHQLVHHAQRVGEHLWITLDGPLSLFSQSTRYGLKLASFFPALLLQDGAWEMEAEVLWTKAKYRKTLRVTYADGLRSHFQDTGAWEPQEHQWFRERWSALNAPWHMGPGREPIDLGGRAVVLPDFTFEKDGRSAHLEIVGYWRKEWLQRRLDLLERYGPGNLILAVSRKLAGDAEKFENFPGVVIPFAEIVPPKAVLEALERAAR
jgi:predicted nuclease of restriction endonuclease-like RecB superfamily